MESKTPLNSQTYGPFTAKMALDVAAPHTWPAAVMPAFVALCAALCTQPVSLPMALVLLAIVVLMQSAVNAFNDYFDFVKGTDDETANVAADDAVLVYNKVNPKAVRNLACGFLAAAFALGVWPVMATGPVPLVIALVGAVFVVAYSAGRTPVSYLPLGEAVSGIVMGGLIPLAVYFVLTGTLQWWMLLWALPEVVGVGLVMFTNNASDIERDRRAGRRTLAVLMGRQRTRVLYRALLAVWFVLIVVNVVAFFPGGIVIMPFMALAAWPQVAALCANPLTADRRLQSMPQILSLNLTLGAFYGACLLCGGQGAFFI